MPRENAAAPTPPGPLFYRNHNFGQDQILGTKYESHNWFRNHLDVLIIVVLAILGLLALALGLPLGMKAGSTSQSEL